MKWYSADQLRTANPQPPPFIVEEILPAGLSVLAAPGKTGKSWLCLQLCDAIATGQTFWGFGTCAGSVLYLALEDSWSRLNSRLQVIGSVAPANLDLVVKDAPTLDAGLIDGLTEWIRESKNPRLVVIDTLARVKGGGKPGLNAYEADYKTFAPLQEFASSNKIAVLGVTHFSKARYMNADDPFERITGSMGLFSVADCTWIIQGKRGSSDQTLQITGRDVGDKQFELNRTNNRWVLEGESDAVRKQRAIDGYMVDPFRQTILGLVRPRGAWTGSARQIGEKMCEFGYATCLPDTGNVGRQITKILPLLSEIDQITVEHGKGGRAGRCYTFIRTG